VAELRLVRFKRVFACVERGKTESAVFGCGGAELGASGAVMQHDGDAGERSGMEIGELAEERTGAWRFDVDEMGLAGVGGDGLRGCCRACGEA